MNDSANKTPEIKLAPATMADAELLFSWANDPAVRSMALSTSEISWETHKTWLSKKLGSPASFLYIGYSPGQDAVGQVRFDISESGKAEVDIHTSPESRGKGYGAALLNEGVEEFFIDSGCHGVSATVKLENMASLRIFEKAGFNRVDTKNLNGFECALFTRENTLQKND